LRFTHDSLGPGVLDELRLRLAADESGRAYRSTREMSKGVENVVCISRFGRGWGSIDAVIIAVEKSGAAPTGGFSTAGRLCSSRRSPS
jgi:hypothetical protein